MSRRPVTAADLKTLGLAHIDPDDVGVTIDPDDLRRPDWSALGLEGGIEHRKTMAAKYWDDAMPDVDQVVVAALLERNEHPTMARRRQAMRERI